MLYFLEDERTLRVTLYTSRNSLPSGGAESASSFPPKSGPFEESPGLFGLWNFCHFDHRELVVFCFWALEMASFQASNSVAVLPLNWCLVPALVVTVNKFTAISTFAPYIRQKLNDNIVWEDIYLERDRTNTMTNVDTVGRIVWIKYEVVYNGHDSAPDETVVGYVANVFQVALKLLAGKLCASCCSVGWIEGWSCRGAQVSDYHQRSKYRWLSSATCVVSSDMDTMLRSEWYLLDDFLVGYITIRHTRLNCTVSITWRSEVHPCCWPLTWAKIGLFFCVITIR